MTKILLTGITGQVGQELPKTLTNLGEVVGVSRQEFDLSQSEQIKQKIAEIKPNIIVNAGAYTAVDKAEEDSKLAIAINADAPKAIAISANDIGATVVHISTDYVFNGKNHTPYLETDTTDPLGVYGNSKLQGEIGIRENCDRHIILRTAWVYGARGHGNFVKTMIRLGESREELKVVADQIGSPTWSYDIADAITNLLNKSQEDSTINGVYHFTNSGVASWYDFALAIFELSGLSCEVSPIESSEYPTPAQRPHFSVLNKAKIKSITGISIPHWREALVECLVIQGQLKT